MAVEISRHVEFVCARSIDVDSLRIETIWFWHRQGRFYFAFACKTDALICACNVFAHRRPWL
jgi:hypothetical protein